MEFENTDLFTYVLGGSGFVISTLLTWLIYLVNSDRKNNLEMLKALSVTVREQQKEIYENSTNIKLLYQTVKSNEDRDEKRLDVMEKIIDSIAVGTPKKRK